MRNVSALGDVNAERYLSEWLGQRIDVRQGFPVRVLLLRKNPVESTLVFTFHHSSTDGLRAVIFIRAVIESYNNNTGPESVSPDTTRMARKGDELLEFARSQRSRVEHFHLKVFLSLFRRFVIDAVPGPTRVYHDRAGKSKDLEVCYETISGKELEELQQRAVSAGVELNDILVAACYRAVEKWNTWHGRASNRIRVMAPVNISPKGFKNVVSNQASWVSPWTTPQDRTGPVKLLRQVRTRNIDATRNRMAFALVYFFYFCSLFPLTVMRGMCHFLMITRTYVDSILFTNMGLIWPKAGSDEPAVTNMGGARIVNLVGSAPVVTPQGQAICAGIYNRNFNISITHRPALLSKEKARAFLDLYIEEVRDYPVTDQAT